MMWLTVGRRDVVRNENGGRSKDAAPFPDQRSDNKEQPVPPLRFEDLVGAADDEVKPIEGTPLEFPGV